MSGIPRPNLTALICAAVLGAGIAVGLLFAVGAVHTGSSAATVIEQGPRLLPTATKAQPSSLSAPSLYARTAGGVVDITSTGQGSGGGDEGGPFGPFGPFGGPSQQPQQTSSGTGFEFDSSGHILTAAHVVDGASSITVRFEDGKTRNAKLLGEDKSSDVAVLSVNMSGETVDPLPLGSSQALVVGDPLAAIGDPFGYQRSLSTGVVSGLDRTISAPDGFTIPHAIQTDAALNPGNSGGPVLNANGQVIGIADQIATDSSGGSGDSGSAANTGVGFAVPIDVAKSVVPALEEGNTPKHAYLGVGSAPTTGTQTGALVQNVQSGSPAAKAGLHSGDVIKAIDGSPVNGVNDVIDIISARHPGDKVTITVMRGGSTKTLTATLGTQPAQAPNG